jgi:hypothetical protein
MCGVHVTLTFLTTVSQLNSSAGFAGFDGSCMHVHMGNQPGAGRPLCPRQWGWQLGSAAVTRTLIFVEPKEALGSRLQAQQVQLKAQHMQLTARQMQLAAQHMQLTAHHSCSDNV